MREGKVCMYMREGQREKGMRDGEGEGGGKLEKREKGREGGREGGGERERRIGEGGREGGRWGKREKDRGGREGGKLCCRASQVARIYYHPLPRRDLPTHALKPTHLSSHPPGLSTTHTVTTGAVAAVVQRQCATTLRVLGLM